VIPKPNQVKSNKILIHTFFNLPDLPDSSESAIDFYLIVT